MATGVYTVDGVLPPADDVVGSGYDEYEIVSLVAFRSDGARNAE